PGVEVDFGAVPAADFDVVSSTSIVATTPALAAGELYPVVVSWEGTPAAGSDARFLADFLDMPRGHLFHDAVEILRRAGISGGCGGGNFCGGQAVSRSQMAVFLLSSRWGADYTPPACSGVFDDVPCPSPFADWVEALYAAGVTGGCATEPLAYCPAGAVP